MSAIEGDRIRKRGLVRWYEACSLWLTMERA